MAKKPIYWNRANWPSRINQNINSKHSYLLRNYKISKAEWLQIFEDQEYKCKICKVPITLYGKGLGRGEVDHDHETGKVRGILCLNCNRALGHLKDNTQIMTNMIKYIEENIIG